MSWFHDPAVLLRVAPRSPFDESATVEERHDALAQIVLTGAIGVSLYRKNVLPLIWALAFLIVNHLLCAEMNKTTKNYMQIDNYSRQAPTQMQTRNPCQCQPNLNLLETGDQLQTQQTWEGAAPTWGGQPSPQMFSYPNNPGHFDQPYAVRSRLPSSIRVTPDSSMARMFNSPETYAMDQMMAPIPDSTLMARQPVCMMSSNTYSNVMQDGGKLRWIS